MIGGAQSFRLGKDGITWFMAKRLAFLYRTPYKCIAGRHLPGKNKVAWRPGEIGIHASATNCAMGNDVGAMYPQVQTLPEDPAIIFTPHRRLAVA